MESDAENNNSLETRTSHQRKLHYRDLLQKIENLQENEDLNVRTINELNSVLQGANNLNSECDIADRVAKVDETLLDMKVISAASSLLVKCCEAASISASVYDACEFSEKLNEFIQDLENNNEAEGILKLLDVAKDVVCDVPNFTFLSGTYDFTKLPAPKEKKQRKKEVQEKVEKKELRQITGAEKDEEGLSDVTNVLLKLLQDAYEQNTNQPVDYYDFVIDSSSFAATVENIFYCSFILRDGRARLDVDDNRAVLVPQNRKNLKQFRKADGANKQIITSITMNEWQNSNVKEGIIQKYKKKKELNKDFRL